MVRGLYTAASGMLTQEQRLDVATNNLANVNTQGYRPDRAVVSSFDVLLVQRLYDPYKIPFDPLKRKLDPMPVVGKLGTGCYVSEIATDFAAQGPIEYTEKPLDLAIDGQGFFSVQTPTGVRCTRESAFIRNVDNQVVDEDGNALLTETGPLTIPANVATEDISIGIDGTVRAGDQIVGRLQLVDALPGAQKVGYNLVEATGGTTPVGPEVRVQQGAVELSPVQVVREMVDLIQVQRTYEANQKVVTAEDETLEKLLQSVAG
jgi:flagellar basal-body rod protein FlgF